MQEIYCRAGRVELTKEEAQEIYENKKYVVTSTAIWQPHFSDARKKIYFTKISDYKGLARRGRFYTLSAAAINNLFGYQYIMEE